MGIKDWPLDERPRERLLRYGREALSDAELLAIFLRCGRDGMSAVELARATLASAGGLRSLLEADLQQYLDFNGLGEASYAQLQAALEVVRRYLLSNLRRGGPLGNPRMAQDYLRLSMRHLEHEAFLCLFLDNQHQLIAEEELFRGTIDGASVYPREIVKRCLQHNAAAVIFAHNHPSGIAEPSRSDRQLTAKLREALATVDIRVLDHLVIGDIEVVSFAERGLL